MIAVIASRQFIPQAHVILGSAHGRRPAQSHGRGITPSRQQHFAVKWSPTWANSTANRLLTTYHPHPYPTCSDLVFLWHPWSLTAESSALHRTMKSHCSSIYALFSGWEESVCKEIVYFSVSLLILYIYSLSK